MCNERKKKPEPASCALTAIPTTMEAEVSTQREALEAFNRLLDPSHYYDGRHDFEADRGLVQDVLQNPEPTLPHDWTIQKHYGAGRHYYLVLARDGDATHDESVVDERLEEARRVLGVEDGQRQQVWISAVKVAPGGGYRSYTVNTKKVWPHDVPATLIRHDTDPDAQPTLEEAIRSQRCEHGHPCRCEFEGGPQMSGECCVHGEVECSPTPEEAEPARREALRVAEKLAQEYGRQTGDALSRHVLVEAIGASGLWSSPTPGTEAEEVLKKTFVDGYNYGHADQELDKYEPERWWEGRGRLHLSRFAALQQRPEPVAWLEECSRCGWRRGAKLSSATLHGGGCRRCGGNMQMSPLVRALTPATGEEDGDRGECHVD